MHPLKIQIVILWHAKDEWLRGYAQFARKYVEAGYVQVEQHRPALHAMPLQPLAPNLQAHLMPHPPMCRDTHVFFRVNPQAYLVVQVEL